MAIRQSSMEGLVMLPSKTFWTGKKVLLTGHSGFKGGWLSLWLHRLGAVVTGVSLPPATTPNLFSLAGLSELVDSHFVDITNAEPLSELVKKAAPDIVFHLAAQPLVRVSYREPLQTFAANVMGTAHVLDALRGLFSVKVAVIVTTDKVYRNEEWPYPYRENDPLGGHDPYSASKAAAEIVTASYRDAFLGKQGVAIATARAGNVIGGGDWSEDRLLPDAVRAWASGRPLAVRYPMAIRPWQHVLEPLADYLILVENLWSTPQLAGAFNFGPDTGTVATVREVVEHARKSFGRGKVLWDNSKEQLHEAGRLALEISKARNLLGIVPRWSLGEAINRTMNWYSRQKLGRDAKDLCLTDIDDFETRP